MKLDPKILFRCPFCRDVLADASDLLRCLGCSRTWPVNAGGIRFLDDGNKAIDGGFDRRWEEHPKFQASRGDFWSKTGWEPRDIEGKVVLDGGCGVGRYLAIAAAAGAHVIGLDAAPHALAACTKNVPDALVAQANLLSIPMGSNKVDAAYSLGVLHHTADPAAAFAELARVVKPGGRVAIWVYTKHISTEAWWPAFEFMHAISKACPPDALYEACKKYAVPMRDAYAGKWDGLAQVVRASGSTDDEECISDTFDWHAPQYRFWHTVEEVRGWFDKAGVSVERVGDFPTSVSGIKGK